MDTYNNSAELWQRLTALEAEFAALKTLDRTQFVGVKYAQTSGQSLTTGIVTTINFGTLVDDPYSLVTTPTTNWTFTAPIAGRYAVASQIIFASTTAWALGEAANFGVYKGGVIDQLLDRDDQMNSSVTAQSKRLGGMLYVDCAKGNTLTIQALQNSGGALALRTDAGYNYVCIWLIN